MYARLFTAHVQDSKLEEFATAFTEQLLPNICREHGFKSTYMMKNAAQSKITVIVFWETEADAQASIDGYLHRRLPIMQNLMIEQPISETLEVVLRA